VHPESQPLTAWLLGLAACTVPCGCIWANEGMHPACARLVLAPDACAAADTARRHRPPAGGAARVPPARHVHLLLLLASCALLAWHAEGQNPPPPPPPPPPPAAYATAHVNTVVGAAGSPGSTTGASGIASLTNPTSMAFNKNTGEVYVSHSHRIMKVTLTSDYSVQVAGSIVAGPIDGPGSTAQFDEPRGLVWRSSENALYVADSQNCLIRRAKHDGTDYQVTTLTGDLGFSCGYVNGDVNNVQLNTPWGLALHPNNDDLYFSEPANACIRKISLTTLIVSDAVGQCQTPGYADGTAVMAQFGAGGPLGIAFRGDDLWILDPGNYVVRVFWANGTVSTVAGRRRRLLGVLLPTHVGICII
jgi:hypothetical protein